MEKQLDMEVLYSLGLGVNERAHSNTYINGHNNGGSSGNIRWNHANGNIVDGSQGTTSASTYANDDILGFAMDLDNNKLYFSNQGVFQNNGDPTSGSTGTGAYSIEPPASNGTGVYHFAVGDAGGGSPVIQCNFGNPIVALSSGNSDANGYGNFEYAVPSGYYSLNSKNLAEFG